MDLPLATLFVCLVVAYGVRHVHDHLFVPLLHQIRRTDEQLIEEFTYYERTCTATDVTTHNITDLVVTLNSSIAQAVDQMMTHGVLLIPQVLPPDIVRDLRRYLVKRTSHLPETEMIPVSQGANRRSFALDVTESEIVTRAIEHVAYNNVLQPLIEDLVGGTDPAVTEITAITAYFGCIDQAWHPDVKQDGNAAKYARTYSPSYSLFIPLQDTTHAMGATDICPGTHYCSNDLTDVCEANKMSLSQSFSASAWTAGDAALLNQQVWHRGARHEDPHALPRVVFIMSFMARPTVDDPRQFSRGTYFHMKWNMWGHTWRDLMDAHYSMIKPFSILRCLGLWKPSADRHWGYDLITASIFRIANNQLGMQAEDLRFFVNNVMNKIYYPRRLQGPLPTDDTDVDVWQVYIRETINKTVRMLHVCNSVALGLYVLLSLVLTRISRTTLTGMMTRLLSILVVVTIGAIFFLDRINKSNWAADMKFRRPFLSVPPKQFLNMTRTTLPSRADVLVGTRYDSEFMGAYARWLNYHPGNVAFQSVVLENANYYQSYYGLPKVFQEHMLFNVVDRVIERRNRFLKQEPSTGTWMVMSFEEARQHAHLELTTCNRSRLSSLLEAFRSLSANYRFGRFRQTKLSRIAVSFLSQLQTLLLRTAPESHTNSISQAELQPNCTVMWRHVTPTFALAHNILARPHILRQFSLKKVPSPTGMDSNLRAGDVVICNFDGRRTPLQGSITNAWSDGLFDVAFSDGDNTIRNLPS
jgi:ectoine hydroxylase-related dioxygenase (phytanoyl-CoA dioxygenase family)